MVMSIGSLDSVIGDWWQQCKRDAAKAKKIPMLVFTKNRDAVYCLTSARTFKQLGIVRGARAILALPDIRIFRWDDLLRVEYQVVFERLKESA